MRALLLICWCIHLATSQECNKSGLCSVGKVQPWSGDVATAQALRAALQARSFQREVIIASTDPKHLELTYLFESQLLRLGLAHLLVLTTSDRDCGAVVAKLPHLGCAWDSTPLPPRMFWKESLAWSLRWKFLLRAARIGYNVMSLDLDVAVFSDPYLHLKQPPFQNMTLLGNRENDCGMNGGFVYIQNAAPDGPATWLFKEVSYRPLRVMDDGMAAVQAWASDKKVARVDPANCMTFDQCWLDDALASTLIVAPYYRRLIEACGTEELHRSPRVTTMIQQDPNHECESFVTAHSTGVDDRQAPGNLPRNYYRSGDMHVPNISEAEWHLRHLNFTLLPKASGPWSSALLQQLKQDCPDCPPWRDDLLLTSGRDAAGGRDNVPPPAGGRDVVETFGFVPQWLFASYQMTGREGYWCSHPVTGAPPLQVMGHIHWYSGCNNRCKPANAIMHHPGINFTTLAHIRPTHSPYLLNRTVTRALALSPSIDLTRVASNVTELLRVAAGLIQLAVLSDRALVWPAAPCNATWMLVDRAGNGVAGATDGGRGSPPQLPLRIHERLTPYVDVGLSRTSHVCLPTVLLIGACIVNARALLAPEFAHFKATHGGPSGGVMTADNTIMSPDAATLAKLYSGDTDGRLEGVSRMAVLDVSDARTALERVKTDPVVYIGYPVAVEGLPEDFDFQARGWGCPGMHKGLQTPRHVGDWFDHHEQTTQRMPPERLHKVAVAGMAKAKLGADGRTLTLA